MVIPEPHPARPAGDVLGAPPRVVLEPGSLAEAAEGMRGLARDRLSVVFVGGDTELGLGSPPGRADAVLRTRGLGAVREYAPSDQIVAVEAGMTLAALQAHLAPQRQRLALDPPFPERATVGGIVAANAFGPRRTRYGAVRDLVIGVTLVRADGVVARGGGKVVKNVAGFDLPRLLCGSLGTLGLVAEVVFRLHPLPEASATAVLEGLDAVDVRETVPAVRGLGVEPAAIAALGTEGRFTVLVRFEGFAPGVRDQVERTLARAGAGSRVDGAEEAALWARHDALRTSGAVRAKATFAPAALVRALEAIRRLSDVLRGAGLVVYPSVGVAFASGDLEGTDGTAATAAARAIEAARETLRPLGNGALVLAEAPPELRARVDAWGPAPSAIEVMRRLKHELDPDGRLAPGRFVGGI